MKKLLKPSRGGDQSSPPPGAGVPTHPPFPIVGIGASAGGLEALELFLRQVPAQCGMAFVVVQHLDPTHKGILPELLQRVTGLEVLQVRDRMRVKADHVYVIPPNKDLSILHGVLHLFEPAMPRGLRLPIDFFLRSLAEDRQERCAGVILSGMGTDGTIGLRAIKEKSGVVLVQDPASAKFDSMPRSAIDAGLADLVAPAEGLPGKIFDYFRHVHAVAKNDLVLAEKDRSSLEKILLLLRSKTGQDFTQYKKNTVYRRVERRMGIHQIDRIASYVRLLQENPQEVELLFKELLIGVTGFFRDPAAWEELKGKAIAELLAAAPTDGVLRAWSAGCSTGEEAYTLAIAFKETLEETGRAGKFTLQIFATDLDRDAIDKARQGCYPPNIAADLSPERLKRFFVKEEVGYRVGKEIREMITFATQNVIMDPPFTRLDLLVCRNLMIYLMPELQKRLLPLFHYSLKPDGVLFLGSAETVSSCADLFTPVDLKLRIYRRRACALSTEHLVFPPSVVPAHKDLPKEQKMSIAANLQSLTDQLLLQQVFPPAVLVNGKGDILYFSGRTGKYLEHAAGKATLNIFVMASEGLRFELGRAFQKALAQKETVVVRGLKIGEDPAAQAVDLTVRPVQEPETLRGMVLIIFSDVEAPQVKKGAGRGKKGGSGSTRVLELEREMKHLHEELQTTREEMQSSQEELKSSNEELQSANEELQSTNEELTTSREELQSLNEELQTMNAEQQSKMDELVRTSDDMRNLLNSTEIVTVFLDNDLKIRRFTNGANQLFKLLPGDVGRPLTDITSDLLYPEMIGEAREVLRTLAFSEKQVTTSDKRWFLVRIMPYRTMDDAIRGVVITFSDISAAKRLEAELRAEIAGLKARCETGS